MINRHTTVKNGAADAVPSISGKNSAAEKPVTAASLPALYNTTETADYLRLSHSARSALYIWLASRLREPFLGPKGPEILAAWSGLPNSKRTILQTYLILCKENGRNFSKKKIRNAAIRAASEGTPQQPSDSSIGRAFNDFEKLADFDLMENDEVRLFLTEDILG